MAIFRIGDSLPTTGICPISPRSDAGRETSRVNQAKSMHVAARIHSSPPTGTQPLGMMTDTLGRRGRTLLGVRQRHSPSLPTRATRSSMSPPSEYRLHFNLILRERQTLGQSMRGSRADFPPTWRICNACSPSLRLAWPVVRRTDRCRRFATIPVLIRPSHRSIDDWRAGLPDVRPPEGRGRSFPRAP